MIFSKWFEPMLRDVFYCMRVLQKSRTSSAIIVLTLGLGIGATTAIFSVWKRFCCGGAAGDLHSRAPGGASRPDDFVAIGVTS